MRSRISGSTPSALQAVADARPCGGPARRWRSPSARRSRRSQTTVVSRWLVMPMAATSRDRELRVAQHLDRGRRSAWSRSPPGRARPSRGREDLSELALGRFHDAALVVEKDGARARRALVEREDVGHGHLAGILRPSENPPGPCSGSPAADSAREPCPKALSHLARDVSRRRNSSASMRISWAAYSARRVEDP